MDACLPRAVRMVYIVAYRNIARAFPKKENNPKPNDALINCSGRWHCCSYLPDTMPLWQAEHGTMRIKKGGVGGWWWGGGCQRDLENALFLLVPARSLVSQRVQTERVDGDDKKRGLFFHYLIVNIAGGCRGWGRGWQRFKNKCSS